MLVVTKILSEFFKRFQNPPATPETSYKMISSNLEIYITNKKQNFKIITFLKNICSLFYPLNLMLDIFKHEISGLLSISNF